MELAGIARSGCYRNARKMDRLDPFHPGRANFDRTDDMLVAEMLAMRMHMRRQRT